MENSTTLADIGVVRRLVLKGITRLQRRLLTHQNKVSIALYYALAKMHFKIYFGKDLTSEVMENSEDARRAAKRHGRMVVGVLHVDVSDARKKVLQAAARGSFTKNLIINAKL